LLSGHKGKKQQGILSTHRSLTLTANRKEPLLVVSLFTQKCALLKEKSSKKEKG